MKKTDLEKHKGLKINSGVNRFGTPGRFAKDAGVPMERREQRKLDQALGLVPFAVKLNGDLVKQVQALAQQRKTGLNEVVAELLKKGLESSVLEPRSHAKDSAGRQRKGVGGTLILVRSTCTLSSESASQTCSS